MNVRRHFPLSRLDRLEAWRRYGEPLTLFVGVLVVVCAMIFGGQVAAKCARGDVPRAGKARMIRASEVNKTQEHPRSERGESRNPHVYATPGPFNFGGDGAGRVGRSQ